MIIIGYEGIGRTTLAKKRSDVIDLELSDFWVNGSEESLYGVYVSVAENLSAGGYIVFVNNHKDVRNKLIYSVEPVGAIYPGVALKYAWVGKLSKRYDTTLSDEDYDAWRSAVDTYDEAIIELSKRCNRRISFQHRK